MHTNIALSPSPQKSFICSLRFAATLCIMCVQYIGGGGGGGGGGIPCAHWGDIMSTSGGVQYIGGIS